MWAIGGLHAPTESRDMKTKSRVLFRWFLMKLNWESPSPINSLQISRLLEERAVKGGSSEE